MSSEQTGKRNITYEPFVTNHNSTFNFQKMPENHTNNTCITFVTYCTKEVGNMFTSYKASQTNSLQFFNVSNLYKTAKFSSKSIKKSTLEGTAINKYYSKPVSFLVNLQIIIWSHDHLDQLTSTSNLMCGICPPYARWSETDILVYHPICCPVFGINMTRCCRKEKLYNSQL